MLEVTNPRWSEQDRAALSAFLAACQGTDPDMTALASLERLLDVAITPALSYVERVVVMRECRALLDGLRAAVAQAKGADDE